jgi:hypothetical protein
MKKPTIKKGKEVPGDTKPITKKEQVQQSNDEKIDQDFPGFPHSPSTEETITKKKKATT